jgi:hypothetical protein
MRRLVISTDGYALSVEACELSGLEVMSVLSILTKTLDEGQFPYPGEPPILEVVKPKEPKKEK